MYSLLYVLIIQDKTGRDVSEIFIPMDGTKTLENYGLKHKHKLTAVFDGKLNNYYKT